MKILMIVLLTLTIVACSHSDKGSSSDSAVSEPNENAFVILGKKVKIEDTKSAKIAVIEISLQKSLPTPGKEATLILPTPTEEIELIIIPISGKDIGLPKMQHAWQGKSKQGHSAFIMLIGNSLIINLQSTEKTFAYKIFDGKKGILEIFQNDRFKENPKDGIIDPTLDKVDDKVGDSSCEDPTTRIDMAMFYTPDARDSAGGETEIENEIAFAIGYTNFAYANSSVTHRLNLIYTGVVSYNEPAAGVDSNSLLGQVASTDDGVLDSIHGTRDAVQADLVSLIYQKDDSSWCGWGQTQVVANADTTDHRAFTVVQRSCAGTSLSFAHEVGHNLGAFHDRANAGTSSVNYNFGHIQPVPSDTAVNPWRSVMSYNSPCNDSASTGSCPRKPIFSNPNVTYLGDTAGVALTATNPEHNVKIMADNDGHVSRYRCLKDAGPANVWMKDRWQDTGDEPDPATAGESMWKSPYIWIRLAEDTSLEHEHEHENPQQGQTNHVYVKTHNTGGASESGDLELYFADASTNLNSPSNWNLINTQALNVSNGVVVSKFDWSGIPGSGHYCLLARWNNDGSPLAFSNVGDAVRASNDLIWRNVNVIGMDDGDQSMSFNVAGDKRAKETYLLIEANPKAPVDIDWSMFGKVTVNIDPNVIDVSNQQLVGVENTAKGEYVFRLSNDVKLIGPFMLDAKQISQVKISLDVDEQAVKELSASLDNRALNDLTFTQITPKGVKFGLSGSDQLFRINGLTLGGVSYELIIPAKK